MVSSSLIRRLCGSRSTIVVSLVVVIALLVPPAVSKADKGADNDRDAHVIKVAASCERKCHDLCAALPKSEDPICDRRCDSISTAFNGSIRDPAALDPKMFSTAVQEIQMCYMGCSVRCVPEDGDASRSCKDKCVDTFRLFSPSIAALGKTMTAIGLAGPETPPPKINFNFETCSDACNRKCAATASQGKTKAACGGNCAEACTLYRGAAAVLQIAMPPQAVPSPAALGEDSVFNTYKACYEHCAANDNKCAYQCSYAYYILTKAKASMKLATGGFGLPA